MNLTSVRIDTDSHLESLRTLRTERLRCEGEIAKLQRRLATIAILVERENRAISRNARLEHDLVEELAYVTTNHVPDLPSTDD